MELRQAPLGYRLGEAVQFSLEFRQDVEDVFEFYAALGVIPFGDAVDHLAEGLGVCRVRFWLADPAGITQQEIHCNAAGETSRTRAFSRISWSPKTITASGSRAKRASACSSLHSLSTGRAKNFRADPFRIRQGRRDWGREGLGAGVCWELIWRKS
jgi:hypothetical protein